jgi:hypothetical protein
MLYAVPRSRYAEYVSFSGGSRFDQEFMIKIDPMLSSLLTIPSTTVERS